MTLEKMLANRIVRYGAVAAGLVAILGAIGLVVRFCVGAVNAYDTVQIVPALVARVDTIDERLWNIEWYTSQLAKRAGIQQPPPRRTRRTDG